MPENLETFHLVSTADDILFPQRSRIVRITRIAQSTDNAIEYAY